MGPENVYAEELRPHEGAAPPSYLPDITNPCEDG
jgi:hypothetical protein